ncbi:fish-egg lectin-like [Acanthochromis polyacanthus]|uniref:fish-egg lectin-like n=1 Tax=Acanthochromis polyacanthus TaxID=80966 RepID=UPI0022346842|nr:fish-egg lectin-like [Acanthochromis polyacanthus]
MKTFLLMLCCLAASHGWTCTEGPRLYSNVAQIDAGQGMVVVRDRYYYAYFLSGNYFYRLGTVRLNHVTVGPAGIWGTDTSNKVHKFIANNFTTVSGSLRQVDAGGDGQVVGITSSNVTYCLRSGYASAYKGTGSVSWSSLSRKMKYVSCSPSNVCWGVDTSSQVYVIQRVIPTTCGTSSWIRVSGISMKMVEISTDGTVFGLATNGRVYQRRGIYSSRPQGTSWLSVPMCMPINHLSYDLGRLWVATTSGLLMVCTH